MQNHCLIRFISAVSILTILLPGMLTAQQEFLTPVQTLSDSIDGVDGLNGVRSLAISPDGKHLYAASQGDFSVTLFRRNIASGELTYIELYRDDTNGVDGLDGARSVVISPDGKTVYVAGEDDTAVAVFQRNPTSGKLAFIQMFDAAKFNAPNLIFATVSPDGKDYFVTTEYGRAPNGEYASSGIWRIQINPNDGMLTEEGEIFQDGHDIEDMGGQIAVAVSPDGEHVYATASGGDSLVVFDRDQSNGALTYVESKVHRNEGADGLQNPTSVFLSPNGSHVYVIGNGSPYTIATYSRNKSTGAVDFIEIQSHGIAGVRDMIGPYFGAITPSGSHVFVSTDFDNSVIVFSRNDSTGRLEFVESHDWLDFQEPFRNTLLEVLSMVVSPDGAYLYVGGHNGDAIGVFKIANAGNPEPSIFQINPGLNGSWWYPGTDGQGFLIDVFPDSGVMFVAWFTYDTEHPDESVTANLGHPSQRWLTAQGVYADNQAVLDVYVTGGGLFDSYPPVPTRDKDGTLTIEFSDCNTGMISYDIPSIGRQGQIPIQRIVTENVPLCEALGGL